MSDINPQTVESILQQGVIERFKAYADGSLVVDYCCGCWHHERRGWQIGCKFHEGMEYGIERLRAVLATVDALHSPLAHDTCLACGHDWPCPTHQLIHPEEARRG